MSNEQLKNHIDKRLDRLEQILESIQNILESNTDASQEAHDIRIRMQKTKEALRKMEYEKWFNENKDRVSSTANMEVQK
jgi:ElaB/YqjD/DUF883 family membrane-anchored ribosome-binding protein